MSRSGQIIEKSKGSITFVVDTGLPAPIGHLECPRKGQEIAWSILYDDLITGKLPEIFAISCPDAKLFGYQKDVFFQTLVKAFAEHRPVVLSPDMIWLLICQGFSHHINMNPEKFRDRIVSHKGKQELVVNYTCSEDLSVQDWSLIIDSFTKQVEENTKEGIASALVTDYSTTGPAEAAASRITLLDAVKPFFEFVVHHLICGIPYITLKGLPEDWEKMIDKVRPLAKFDLEWWIDSLIPILHEFVETANGRPKASFWKNIVKKTRPGEMRGRGCIPSESRSSTVDGWFLKFFPYNRYGRTPKAVKFDETMLPETVSVSFKYRLVDSSGSIISETLMDMTAGFLGIEEDPQTYALTPKIGWFIRKSESEDVVLAKLKEQSQFDGIQLRILEVPPILKRFKHIRSLYLHFVGKVNLPDWLDMIKIDYLVVTGELTKEEKDGIRQRFPKCEFWD